MQKIFDLRFVIGAFFLIIGLLLLIYHFSSTTPSAVNSWCGVIFSLFGVIMIVLSYRSTAPSDNKD